MRHEVPQPRPVHLEDGSLNTDYLNETWGISSEFAQQTVTFDTGESVFSGTVADMLADTACPVGGRAAVLYQKKGIEGVVGYFNGIVDVMGAEFSEGTELNLQTIASEDVKKNLISPKPPTR
jgi:hypothetical protein